MDNQDLTIIADIFKVLKEFKKAVLEFYETAAAVWQEDKGFWLSLSEEDKKHLQDIDEMADIVKNNPTDFEIGEHFKLDLAASVISEIKADIEKLKNSGLSKKETFVAGRNIKQSAVGAKYSEIVKTNNSRYIELAKEIISQSLLHKGKINKKISGLDKGIQEVKQKPKIIIPEISATPAKEAQAPEMASENLIRVNRYHNQFREYLEFAGKIEGELHKHSVWMHLEKIENFMKRDMAEHFKYEEESVFPEILAASSEEGIKKLVTEMIIEHKELLEMMGAFEKAVYGEIFPLPKAKVEEIEKLLKTLVTASLNHIVKEEDKILPLIK